MASAAEILTLDAWRDPDGVLHRAIRRAPWPHGWHDLRALNMSDKRDAVKIYGRMGLHPILLHGVTERGTCTCGRPACAAAGKHPVMKGWQQADLDVPEVTRRLLENYRYNIGLRMGLQPSGERLVCIDIDGDRSLLEPLEARMGKLPPTLTASTGKGLHMIYRLRPGAPAPKNSVRIGDGVDVRSEGGQIVAAPSVHASGRRYTWIDCRAPEVLP